MEVPSIFLNRILAEAVKKGASSLHFSVGSQPVTRIDNELISMEKESILTSEWLDKIIESFISEEEEKKFKEEKEIVVVKTFAGDFRFRVNIFYQKDLPALSFNYVPTVIRSLEDLKLPIAFREKISLNSGLLIVAGPNDSGKTSTAAAFIKMLIRRKKDILLLWKIRLNIYSSIKKALLSKGKSAGT